MQETTTRRPGSVTCVVVAFNHAEYVEQCLDSAFAQTYPDVRVIIFDDASSDDSHEVIRAYLDRNGHDDVTFVAHEVNRGLCSTLNEALDLVDTEFMALIAADDWMVPERFAIQVEEMNRLGTEYAMLFNDLYVVDADGIDTGRTYLTTYDFGDLIDGQLTRQEMLKRQLKRWLLPTPGLLYRRSAFDVVGQFDAGLVTEDIDITFRMLRSFNIAYNRVPVVYRRELAGSLSKAIRGDQSKHDRELVAIMRKHLGSDDAVDSIVAAEIGARAKRLYLAGASYPELARDLKFALSKHRSPTTALYLIAHGIRVPGQVFGYLVAQTRRLKAALKRSPGRARRAQ